MNIEDLVAAVRAHAIANYTKDGWDYIVECYSRAEIADLIQKANAETVEQAIAAAYEDIRPYHEYAEDIRGYGGCRDETDSDNLPCAFEPAESDAN